MVVCAAAAAVLFAVLIVLTLEVAASGDSDPRVGDHWHAPYSVFVCGQRQPSIAEFPHSSGIHTHGDGIMHMHPRTPGGEGRGASVAQFFKNAGGWVDPALTPEGCAIDYSHPIVLRGHFRLAVDGAFVTGGAFADRRVAIVDDVMTSGHTANALAESLLRSGAVEVRVWVVARA